MEVSKKHQLLQKLIKTLKKIHKHKKGYGEIKFYTKKLLVAIKQIET